MQNTTTNVIAICLVAALLFVAPLIALTERNDNVVQENVELIVNEFVTDIQNTGVLSQAKYQSLENSLAATGNTYNIEMEIQHLDENPGKKTTWAVSDKIGENIYYSVYTSQIEDVLGSNGKYVLKEGDIVSVSVKNTNTTISQMLRNFFYTVSGSDTYQVYAQHAAMVKSNGK